jgi:hypothetical protein
MTDLQAMNSLLLLLHQQGATILASQSALATRMDAIEHRLQPPPDQRLIMALAETFGDREFTAREAIELSRSLAPALAAAIMAACGRVDGRVLGNRLARIENTKDGPFLLTRLDAVRDGLAWRIYPRGAAVG